MAGIVDEHARPARQIFSNQGSFESNPMHSAACSIVKSTSAHEKKRPRWLVSLCVALLLGSVSPTADAVFGYFLNGASANSRAMAGTGVAFGEDALTVALNPANMARLSGDRQWLVGVTLIQGKPEFTASEFDVPEGGLPPGAFAIRPGRYEQDADVALQVADVFPIPNGAISWKLDNRSAVGIAVYGNGGLNNTYQSFENPSCPANTPQAGVLCFGDLASDIAQTFVATSYARQINAHLSVGASLLAVWQALEMRGLGLFADRSRAPDHLTNKGHDNAYGIGAKLGVQYRLVSRLHVGVAYQTRTYTTRFEDYAGLLAERGGFDIPPQIQAGISWDVTSRWQLQFDVQRIWFSDVASLANAQDASGRLGDEDGPGLGWSDVTAYKVGAKYVHDPKWTFRAGYATNDSPLPSPLLLNLLTLSTFDEQATAGLSYGYGPRTSLDLAVTYSLPEETSGPNPLFRQQQIRGANRIFTVDLAWRQQF